MDKLLILGATYHEIYIVERAHKKGIYTIVTDSHTDWSQSPAKSVADEAWNISWSDIDSLVLKCRETGVNGVMAGFSEFRVENMIKLCGRLNLPCTLSMEQLDITRDKIKFKQLCAEYDIPGVPEYKYGDPITYPVIVKPVDRAGSIGINVAYNQDEFEQHYRTAYDLSPSKSVIVEEFINDGIKVDFYYYIKDGNVALLGTSDTIMCEGELGAPILQKAWVFPSRYQELYLAGVDLKIRKMLLGLGMRNGYVTMSAFYRDGSFFFFEAGFRLSGELSYNFYNQISGIHYIDTLLDYSLGKSNSDVYQDCYELNSVTKSVILNYFALSGSIGKIEKPVCGENEAVEVIADFYAKEGDTICNDTNVFKKVAMYTIFSDKEELLESTIGYINSNLHVIDTAGNEMVYEVADEKSFGYSCETSHVAGREVRLMCKPYWVMWRDVQDVLDKAHETNMKNALLYATYNQPVSKLKEKTRNSVCLVVFVDGSLAATGTVQFMNINYWYHSGKIGLLKLLAVSPEYRGLKLSDLIVKAIKRVSAENNIDVIVSDSAESNLAIKNLYLKNNFCIVDCCKYLSNNFVSTVYAYWADGTPWSETEMQDRYNEHRDTIE